MRHFLSLVLVITILILSTSLISGSNAAPNADKYRKAKFPGGMNKKAAHSSLKKRDGGLAHALSLSVIGVGIGVVSTLDGISHPKTSGTAADEQRAAAEAGENVGGAFGTALRGGLL